MQHMARPPPHISPKGTWVSKLVLRILQVIFAVSLAACAGALAPSTAWVLVVSVPQACVSAIWALAEAICILARGGHRGIHPGACVAVDLLLWLGLITGTVFLGILGVVSDLGWDYGYRSSSSSLERALATGRAMLALASLLTVAHFTTFIIACVETSQRNRAAPVVYLAAVPPAQFAPQQYPSQYYQYPPQYELGGQPAPYPSQPQPAYQQPRSEAKP